MVQGDDGLLIENLAVEPKFQKRGYGRKMVAHAEQLAVCAGSAVVRLYTNSQFEENVRLYLSLDYEIEREEPLNGGVLIHMFKHVS
ncbi:acetyltransferase (GNAT) family protein [Novosphingobium sp. PhB165]|nr:acetyltransferase (GNAT) family protein [Novosphingobium sp. PhB165]